MNAGEAAAVAAAVLGGLGTVIGGLRSWMASVRAAAEADAARARAERATALAQLETMQAKRELTMAENARLVARVGVLERDLEDMAHERQKMLPHLNPSARAVFDTGFAPFESGSTPR
jgi:hypothetical protein